MYLGGKENNTFCNVLNCVQSVMIAVKSSTHRVYGPQGSSDVTVFQRTGFMEIGSIPSPLFIAPNSVLRPPLSLIILMNVAADSEGYALLVATGVVAFKCPDM